MPHHHHHPEWIFNFEDENIDIKKIGKVISKIGQSLINKSEVEIKGNVVKPPNPVHFVLRHERAPHNDFVFKIEIIWPAGTKRQDIGSIEDIEDIVT